ncbi:hypothetical protein JTE90_012244 [Oedothorax gibbosus]|uniref:Uncharacterized protein n=1 Tax=Oedothorax gibbosus TaxID=931172 RepID=A0AAV6UYT0_9ARAC|nr:hypothetical protein JTE90_012244 [Oedothorax gibbosus]
MSARVESVVVIHRRYIKAGIAVAGEMRLLTLLGVALFALQCINTEVVYGGDTLPTPNVLETEEDKVELKHIEKRSLGPFRFPFRRRRPGFGK